MDRDIPITSVNSDRQATEPVRIRKKTILPFHFFKRILTNVMKISNLNKLASSYYAFVERSVLTLIQSSISFY